MLDSKALTKIQSAILIAVIAVAATVGSLAYILWSEQEQTETIKIGVLYDLDSINGIPVWQSVVFAAEQLNAKGGILGKQVKVVGEDTDSSSGGDPVKINSALTRLLTFHKVDFVIGASGSEGLMVQEVIGEHKKIFFDIGSTQNEYTQRVLDDYDNYKYYFRPFLNATTIFQGMTDSFLLLREQTGFNKIGYLGEDRGVMKSIMIGLDNVLPQLGFDLIYKGAFPLGTVDFSSYFVKAEEAGVEILVPLMVLDESVPFVKEYHERQPPMLVYGGALGGGIPEPEGWEITDGKCEYIAGSATPTSAGYPFTSKTLPAREAYIDRWGENPSRFGGYAYDTMRYILPDAIERAGTIEVNLVIQALEAANLETANAKKFQFTSSHDILIGDYTNDPDADFNVVFLFQWIDGNQVPVYPKKFMEEAGASYIFPDWSGPWDSIS